MADDGWIEWKGGECPVDADTVIAQVRLRNGRDDLYPNVLARKFRWSHLGNSLDIIAYRIVEQ